MNRISFRRCLFGAAAFLVLGLPAFAGQPERPRNLKLAPQLKHAGRPSPDYQLVPIPLPADALSGGDAVQINNRGTVSGVLFLSSSFPATEVESFVWRDGVLTRYAAPGATITSVANIADNERTLFGNWGTVTEQRAGFLVLQTGSWIALPAIPGKPIIFGQRANNRGQAIGGACEGTVIEPVNCQWWIWDGRRYTFPSPTEAIPIGLNDRGQIVGQLLIQDPFDVKAFFFDKGDLQTLLPEKTAVAYGINNVGEITLVTADSPFEAGTPSLLWFGGLRPLPIINGSLTTIWFGINERGDLAGTAVDPITFKGNPYVAVRK